MEDEKREEIQALIKRIKKAGFEKETFRYLSPPELSEEEIKNPHRPTINPKNIPESQYVKHEIEIWNRIKQIKLKEGKNAPHKKFRNDNELIDAVTIQSHAQRTEQFFNRYAAIIYNHAQKMKPYFLKETMSEIIKDRISEVKAFLQSPPAQQQPFSKKTIDSVIKPITKRQITEIFKPLNPEQSKKLDKLFKSHISLESDLKIQFVDHQESGDFDPLQYRENTFENRDWKPNERKAIFEIINLYKIYTALSERQILGNMALVFHEVKFYPHFNPKKSPAAEKKVSIYETLFNRIKGDYNRVPEWLKTDQDEKYLDQEMKLRLGIEKPEF